MKGSWSALNGSSSIRRNNESFPSQIEPSIQFDITNDVLIDVEIIRIIIVRQLTSN